MAIMDDLSQIRALWKAFQEDWEKCRQEWRDEVASNFATEFVAPWKPAIEELLERLEALALELQKAKNLLQRGRM
jgi:uncharacterized protein YukE